MPRPRPEFPQLEFKRGKWYIRYWDEEGTRRFLSTKTDNERTARQALADFESIKERPIELSVSDALDRYMEDRRGKVHRFANIQKAANALRVSLGDFRVDQINQEQWDNYAKNRFTRAREGQKNHVPKPVASGTLKNDYIFLMCALRLAIKDGDLQRLPNIDPPQSSPPRQGFLTKIEARNIVNAATLPHMKLFLEIAFATGARKTAILELSWDRVDFKTGLVDFRNPAIKATKKRRAVVPMNSELREVLKSAFSNRKTNYVVEFRGNRLRDLLQGSFHNLCKRAGVEWKPTLHHARHSVASWFAEAKVPIDQAADYLAMSRRILESVYRHFRPDYLKEYAEVLRF